MALTLTQQQAVKADIVGDATLNQHAQDGNFSLIQDAYAAQFSPDYWIWRGRVTWDELMGDAGMDWTEVDGLTIGKARIWEWLFANLNRAINATMANVRAGIANCWSGNAGRVAVQQAVLARCRRLANRGEKVLASGAGTTVAPSIPSFEGALSAQDIIEAYRLP